MRHNPAQLKEGSLVCLPAGGEVTVDLSAATATRLSIARHDRNSLVNRFILQLEVLVLLFAALATLGQADDATPVGGPVPLVLENAFCRVEIERQHGRLLRLLDRQGKIDLQSPAELAENFRVLVPLPDAPRNVVRGRDQALASLRSRFTARPAHG